MKAQKQNACIALYSYLTHYFVLTHLLIKQLSHEKHQGLSYVTVEERTGNLVTKEHPTVAIDDISFEKFSIQETCSVGSF